MGVAPELDLFNSSTRSRADLVNNCFFTILLLDRCIHLYFEVSLIPEIRHQTLPPILNQFRRQTAFLIGEKEFALGSTGELRAFDAGLNDRSSIYAQGNVSPVGLRVVTGVGYFDLNKRMRVVGKTRLQVPGRIP